MQARIAIALLKNRQVQTILLVCVLTGFGERERHGGSLERSAGAIVPGMPFSAGRRDRCDPDGASVA